MFVFTNSYKLSVMILVIQIQIVMPDLMTFGSVLCKDDSYPVPPSIIILDNQRLMAADV